MNLLWMESGGPYMEIPRSDRKYAHILRILKKNRGDRLLAGSRDGTLGEAEILEVSEESIRLSYLPRTEAPPLHPLRVLVGFPRPIQAGRLLKDLTSLGVESVWFALSELGEKSYAESAFFRSGEYAAHLIEGAEQAGNPRLPEVRTFWSVDRALEALPALERGMPGTRLVLHPGADLPRLSTARPCGKPVIVAIGSERGWTDTEVLVLAKHGFAAHSLGSRILKTETAATAAVSVCLGILGLI